MKQLLENQIKRFREEFSYLQKRTFNDGGFSGAGSFYDVICNTEVEQFIFSIQSEILNKFRAEIIKSQELCNNDGLEKICNCHKSLTDLLTKLDK